MEMRVFKNEEFGAVRSMTIENEPWFAGKDVCRVFGDKNHNRSLSRIDDEDKREMEIIDSLGRKQTAVFINESGLYALLFSMQPQKANTNGVPDAYPIEVKERIERLQKFKRWVTSEVLPSIRRHGMYAIDDILANPDIAIAALKELKAEREKRITLENESAVQKMQIAEMKPKADYHDIVLSCTDAVSISVIAKDYGMTAQMMNEKLRELGVQYKQGDVWLLYRDYAANGYTKTATYPYKDSCGNVHTKVHTKWTQKGRFFIYHTLKNAGILPEIEVKA